MKKALAVLQLPVTKALILGVIFALFLIRSYLLWDPDFSWHLKMGEYILGFGIPRLDPFSYTMPAFPVVSHEWLVDIVLYRIYSLLGYVSLAAIFSGLVFLAIFIAFKSVYPKSQPKVLQLYNIGIFVLSSASLITSAGVRPQVLSWLFLAIILFIIYSKNTRLKYVLPVVFFIWTNLHGSFAAGIATLGLYIFGKTLRTRRLHWDWNIIALGSLIATLLNPYVEGVWREVWSSVSDSNLRWRIAEWRPAILNFDLSLAAIIAVSLFFLLRYRKKFLLEEKLIYIFFLVEGIASARHVPLFLVISIPIFLRGGKYLAKQIAKDKIAEHRLVIFSALLLIIFSAIFAVSAYSSIRLASSLRLNTYYPAKAIEFLKTNQPDGEVFSEYAWGGYLIWKYPEKKVFIDGRMPSWKLVEGDKTVSAMDDYIDLLTGQLHHKTAFASYNIKTVLWPKSRLTSEQNTRWNTLMNSIFGFQKFYFSFTRDLERNKWNKVYEDETAVIFQKP